MIASKTELEQMARDGKGRPTVVKAMAQAVLEGKSINIENLSVGDRRSLANTMAAMVENWPNTMELIFKLAKEKTKFTGSPDAWWRHWRNNLVLAAREYAGRPD